jgi:hypothetical protein
VHSVHLPEKLLDIAHNPKLFYKMKEKMQAFSTILTSQGSQLRGQLYRFNKTAEKT